MAKNGARNGKQDWRCADKKDRQQRYMEKFLNVTAGGLRFRYPIAPELKISLQEALSEFRARQRQEYLEVNKVWLDQLDNHAK